jgi:quinol monooxygenase YgiN
MVTQGLIVRLEAKADMNDQVEEFLRSAETLVHQEATTTAWFAVRFGRSEYGIIDFFPDEGGRQAHLNGAVASALFAKADALFAQPPTSQKLTVLADKLPVVATFEYSTKALLLSFKAKPGHEQAVETFLRDAQALVEDEAYTTTWFAVRFDDGEYGIFDTFGGPHGRFEHLTGHVPRQLAKHALTLLGGVPDIDLIDVLAEKVLV